MQDEGSFWSHEWSQMCHVVLLHVWPRCMYAYTHPHTAFNICILHTLPMTNQIPRDDVLQRTFKSATLPWAQCPLQGVAAKALDGLSEGATYRFQRFQGKAGGQFSITACCFGCHWRRSYLSLPALSKEGWVTVFYHKALLGWLEGRPVYRLQHF